MFEADAPERQTDSPDDDFFVPLENTKPYFKAAFEGFAGTGKTFTAAQVVIGLHRRIQSTKPIVLFDTEKAAKFLLPFFREAGIKTLHKQSRSLADLAETMRRCGDGISDILFVDSLTHVWENFLDAYKQRKAEQKKKPITSVRLDISDWGVVKPLWKKEFSEPFVFGKFHAVITGRAGYEYEDREDEETGKSKIVKTGIKMKVEGETAYEPDILVLMDRFEEVLEDKRNKKVWREATVLKDRSTLIDGKTFEQPTYEDFAPVVERILLDAAEDRGVPERSAGGLIKDDNTREYAQRREQELEEIQGTMVSAWPGQTAMEKKSKSDALAYAFDTRSWEKISTMAPSELSAGHERIKQFITKQQQETAS